MKHLEKKYVQAVTHRELWEHDEREWYGHDPHDYYALGYRRRISFIVKTIIKTGARNCLEVGCAQGNMSLSLAEQGISAVAMDINPHFLDYSRLKYEKGGIRWLRAEGYHLPVCSNSLEAVILAEILEHCAYPEHVLSEAYRVLAPGGLCVITTPNHDSRLNGLCSFSEIENDRQSIEKHQFGPDGEDHLFLFSRKELESLTRAAGFAIAESRLLNHHFLMWKHLYHLRRAFPAFWNGFLEKLVPAIPVLSERYTHCLFIAANKKRETVTQAGFKSSQSACFKGK